jgi:hypothetical protein
MDQVAWASVNIMAGGEMQQFHRGDLLPEAASSDEASNRSLLRLGGAIRTVEVVYTAEELADQAQQRAVATAARETALDVNPDLPLAQQVPGSAPAGRPTLVEPSGSPVVLASEEDRAAHQRQSEQAEQARSEEASQPPPPPANASKAAWVRHAVEVHGADQGEAEGMTRDQLRGQYTAPAGQRGVSSPPLQADVQAQSETAAIKAGQNPDAGKPVDQQDERAEPGGPVQVGAEDDSSGNAPGGAPAADASEQEWRDWAVSRGADPAQASVMSKDELIAAYGPPCG